MLDFVGFFCYFIKAYRFMRVIYNITGGRSYETSQNH